MTTPTVKNAETGKKKLVYFATSLASAVALTWLIRETAFTQSQTYVLFLLILSVGLWLTEAVPPFAVGLFIIGFLAYSLGNEIFISKPEDIHIYLNTFSNSVIWLMLGGFFLASAMTKVKLDEVLIQRTLKVCGKDPKWILFGMMTITMVSSMLISNTATTAMVVAALMPLLLKLGKKSSVSKGLILGIPIAATTGGMGTLIGSPPNAIAAGALIAVDKPIDFISWILYGLPVTLALTGLAWWMLVKLFMKGAEPISLSAIEKNDTDEKPSAIQRWTVIIILAVTLLLWLSSPFHSLSAPAVSAIPLVFLPLTGILNGNDIRAMGWDTLLLVAGGLSLGTALQHTGLMGLYAQRIAGLEVPPIAFLFLLGYATMLFSNIMSNTATSTVLIPLGMAILPNQQVEVAMIIGLTASTALILPVSTPPNAIAYATGYIEQKDFRYGGILIGLLGPALIILWVLAIS